MFAAGFNLIEPVGRPANVMVATQISGFTHVPFDAKVHPC